MLPKKNTREPLLGRWDVLQSLALVYTATLTPFETCFVPPAISAASWSDPWFLMNGLCIVLCSLTVSLIGSRLARHDAK